MVLVLQLLLSSLSLSVSLAVVAAFVACGCSYTCYDHCCFCCVLPVAVVVIVMVAAVMVGVAFVVGATAVVLVASRLQQSLVCLNCMIPVSIQEKSNASAFCHTITISTQPEQTQVDGRVHKSDGKKLWTTASKKMEKLRNWLRCLSGDTQITQYLPRCQNDVLDRSFQYIAARLLPVFGRKLTSAAWNFWQAGGGVLRDAGSWCWLDNYWWSLTGCLVTSVSSLQLGAHEPQPCQN